MPGRRCFSWIPTRQYGRTATPTLTDASAIAPGLCRWHFVMRASSQHWAVQLASSLLPRMRAQILDAACQSHYKKEHHVLLWRTARSESVKLQGTTCCKPVLTPAAARSWRAVGGSTHTCRMPRLNAYAKLQWAAYSLALSHPFLL